MTGLIVGDVKLDSGMIQDCVQEGTAAAVESAKLLRRLNEKIELALDDPGKVEDLTPYSMVTMQSKIAASNLSMSRSLDMLYRLAEFSEGRADSRPDLGQKDFMKNMSDELLEKFQREVEGGLQMAEDFSRAGKTLQ